MLNKLNMPQILFQDIHHAKNKSLLIMEQLAIYLDFTRNVRGERERVCGERVINRKAR